MSALEISLLIIGLIIFVGSFVLGSKFDKEEPQKDGQITEKQREDIRKQIMSVFDEQMDEIKERTEISLDKLSADKMNEMNEYSETILNEINKNHNEVMFLYDMLNEKKKEINNTVRDLNIVNKEIDSKLSENKEMVAPVAEPIKESKPKSKKAQVLNQLDAATSTVTEDTQVDLDETPAPAKAKRKNTAKTAADRVRTAVKKETIREDNKDITVFENGNNNEKILALSNEGKSNVEIAKALGLGIGEVKLVVDLFKGGK